MMKLPSSVETVPSTGPVKGNRARTRRLAMGSALLLVVILVFILTGLFEIVMVRYSHPGETVWESHLTTVLFSCSAAALAAYFAFRKYDSLLHVLQHAIAKGKAAETALQDSLAELQSLQTITNELLELDDPSQVRGSIARGIVKHLGYDRALVAQCSRSDGTITGLTVFPWTEAARVLADSCSGEVNEGRPSIPGDFRIVNILDQQKVIRYSPDNLFIALASELRIPVNEKDWLSEATIGVAMQIKGETAGIILAGGTTELVLGSADCLVRVAKHASIAMDNAFLFSHVCEQRLNLRELGVRLEEAEETERKRLAAELHDQVGQNLTAMGINLGILEGYLSGKEDNRVKLRIEDTYALIEDTTIRIREVMADLRPPGLDDFGIKGALQWVCEQFSNRTGIKITALIEEINPRPSPLIERTLFRIAQEALTNATRHSDAQNVLLTLESSGGKIRMCLIDDGRGFDTEGKSSMDSPKWGLRIMRERAELAGGTLHIDSKQGKGTKILVEVSDGKENESLPGR
ncbi:MAG: sensor histidine kinase [Syntrophobacteraceae bacterium]